MATARQLDQNGYLTIAGNPLTKVGVFPYRGSEIGAEDPNKIYYVLRPEEELNNPETIDSFKLVPFVDEHEWLGENGTPAEKKGIQGTIGEHVYFDAPYLRGNLRILSESVKNRINNGKIELSAGYSCAYEPIAGTFNGQHYDYVQKNIRANHLALVDKGRSGADVAVLDSLKFTFDTAELIQMSLEELLAAIGALSDEDKAALLAQLNPPVEDEQEEEKPEGVSSTDEQQEPVQDEPIVEPEDNNAAEALAETVAALAEKIAAQDSAALIREIAMRDSLAKRTSEFVGTFDHSAMTTQEVAEYGTKKLGIKCAKGYETIALDAWLQGRVPARAQDSAAEIKPKNLWGDK
jgi:uncharacterized protein